MNKRIAYFDGVKGTIALLNSLLHYMLTFGCDGYVGFGSTPTADPVKSVVEGLPLSLYVNSSLPLNILFALIAFFIFVSYSQKEDQIAYLQREAKRRYVQFLIPVAAIIILSYVLYKVGILNYAGMYEYTGSSWILSIMPTEGSVFRLLYAAFIRYFFTSVPVYYTVLWCMHIIFLGSIGTYAFLALFGKEKKRWLYPVFVLVTACFASPYLVFVAGLLAGEHYIRYNNEKRSVIGEISGIALVVIGVGIGLIPSVFFPKWLSTDITCAIGSMLVIVGIINSNIIKKVFEFKPLVKLGKYLFSIILTHIIVLFTFSYWLYPFTSSISNNRTVNTLINFAISLPVIFLLSFVFYKIAEEPSRKLAKRIK